MFKDEHIVVFEQREVVGSEPNPDFDHEKGLCFENLPNRLVEAVEWITGVDGSDNLAVTQQSSHGSQEAAERAAAKLAKKNGRKTYILQGDSNWIRVEV